MSNHPVIVLATLNARYIHASLGLRYLRANMARHGGADLRSATVLREYTLARHRTHRMGGRCVRAAGVGASGR